MEPNNNILGEDCPEFLHDFDEPGVEFSSIRRRYQFGDYIGGSEAASIMGCGYNSAITVYMQKTQQEDVPDLSGLEHIEWGNMLEPVVLKRTEEMLNLHIEKPNYMYLHPLYDFMTANFDGVSEDGRLVEVKTTDSYKKKSMLEDHVIPDDWLIQMHHYACFRIPSWHKMAGQPFQGLILSAKTHMQKDPIIIECPVDWGLCETIIKEEKAFIQRLKDNNPPPPDGSASATNSIKHMPLGEGEIEKNEEIESHWKAAKDAKASMDLAEKSYKFHKNYIHSLMSEKGCNKIRGISYSRTSKRLSEKLLRKRLAEHNLSHLIEECRQESPPYIVLK